MQNGIDSDFIERLKNTANIVDVISRYIPLSQKGKSFEGCCPFHHEKTPSFKVNQESQFYHCFGCGEGGDVISFVRKYENVDFVKAVEIIANMYGIEVPEAVYTDTVLKDKQIKDKILNINKDAGIYYNKELFKETGAIAQQYLIERGLTSKTIARFGIGFSSGWEGLTNFLLKKGYNKKDLVISGVANEKNGRIFDYFNGRVIFPLINTYGSVIGFSARVLDKNAKTAKYINTKDTPVFNKSKVLYNINNIKKQKQDGTLKYVVLVEGQMDVIKLYEKGVTNAVATLGTALTEFHAREISRFTDTIYVCFDGDSAGQHATLRSLNILKNSGLNVRVCNIETGEDPDEYISKYGKEAFLKLIENGQSIMDYHLKRLSKKYNLNDKEQNIKFVNEAITELKNNSNDIEFDVYLRTISELSKVSLNLLKSKVEKQDVKTDEKPLTETLKSKNANVEATKFILASLLYKNDFAKPIDNEYFYFLDSDLNKLYNLITKKNIIVSSLFDEFDVDNSPIIKEIINYNFNEINNKEQFFNDCVKIILKSNIGLKIDDLQKSLNGEAPDNEKLKYIGKIQELNNIINKLKVEEK